MRWKLPPKIKIYEALGCIADERVEVKGNEARVFSSSRNKFYSVKYDPDKNAIMSNDNGSYWIGYLGYPSIAFLMIKCVIDYNPKFANVLKDIPWKDINVKFKNDFKKTKEHVLQLVEQNYRGNKELMAEVANIFQQIKKLKLNKLGRPIKPPAGY